MQPRFLSDLDSGIEASKLFAMRISVGRMLYDATVDDCLRQMDCHELFATALASRMAGENVHIFIGRTIDEVMHLASYVIHAATRVVLTN
ncbi:hypothetical protein R3P38DRAFT_3211781 [Favolaschia claudopus]|uniref:Uncharacterized protein n=1 Tax=Favolaschia claudopus TaxID=2862362 RepID=A0AAW0AHG7_9AGAR